MGLTVKTPVVRMGVGVMELSDAGLVWLDPCSGNLLGSLVCWMVKYSRLFMSGSRRSVGSIVTPSDQSGTRLDDMLSCGETGDCVGEPGSDTNTVGCVGCLVRGGLEMLTLEELVKGSVTPGGKVGKAVAFTLGNVIG